MCCEPMCVCDPYNNCAVASWTCILPVVLFSIVCSFQPGCNFMMSSVPQGMFAAHQVRGYFNDESNNNFKYSDTSEKLLQPAYNTLREHLPPKYNSKLMNSIWGLYNRYSVHNVKQHTDKSGITSALYHSQQPI